LTSTFQVLPAIDLRAGRVVRLAQGDFERETAFSDDPIAVAARFVADGARWLHVVDLDGARAGTPTHRQVIAGIVEAVGDLTRVEVAGGLRTPDAVASALDGGAARVVVGTAALRDPAFAGDLVARFDPGRIVIAADVRAGSAVGEAWRDGADGAPVEDLIGELVDRGIRTFEVTAIDRDGLLTGPDLELYGRLRRFVPNVALIASAGVATTGDLQAIGDLGAAGAIIGRALYDGQLSLADALAAVDQATIDAETGMVRRPSDGELLGHVRRIDEAWVAETVFGGLLARCTNRSAALDQVESDGLRALARRWWYRPSPAADWQVTLVQEASPTRVTLVLGPYAVPGTPTITVDRTDLASGATLTLERPSEVDADGPW
jgi:phosphoribosylformimino-5-aminoimidazole carboxamide ribotide isomerase